jgi:hypothetical protein
MDLKGDPGDAPFSSAALARLAAAREGEQPAVA